MRGEYFNKTEVSKAYMELPPRARRIREFQQLSSLSLGTTSACAENTYKKSLLGNWIRNYLRVRGEYLARPFVAVEYEELPPRARRIQTIIFIGLKLSGTTSACAENTAGYRPPWQPYGNYLRVRGEYRSRLRPWNTWMELPPRARRIRVRKHNGQPVSGTTSACAENT